MTMYVVFAEPEPPPRSFPRFAPTTGAIGPTDKRTQRATPRLRASRKDNVNGTRATSGATGRIQPGKVRPIVAFAQDAVPDLG
jgi:hypothetical protein